MSSTIKGLLCIAAGMIVVGAGCSDDSSTGSPDAAGADAARLDAAQPDAAAVDGAPVDGSPQPDGAAPDGGGQQDGGGGTCATDTDCTAGSLWCVGGTCVPCDNTGLICDLACGNGWQLYVRNGCHPCECAPLNACTSDGDCGGNDKCYAGAFCWDWCPADDPSCCFGNICTNPGCTITPPTGCVTRGCPQGDTCSASTGCAPSVCSCSGGNWMCTGDCNGGTCL